MNVAHKKSDRDFVNCVAVAQECQDDVAKFRLLSHVVFNLVKELLEDWEVLEFDGHVGLEVAIGHLPALQMLQLVPIRVRPPFNYTECNVPNAPPLRTIPSPPTPDFEKGCTGRGWGQGRGAYTGTLHRISCCGSIVYIYIYVVLFV